MDTTNPHIIPEAKMSKLVNIKGEELEKLQKPRLSHYTLPELAEKELRKLKEWARNLHLYFRNSTEILENAFRLIEPKSKKWDFTFWNPLFEGYNNQAYIHNEARKLFEGGHINEAKELLLIGEFFLKVALAKFHGTNAESQKYSYTGDLYKICYTWKNIIGDKEKTIAMLGEIYVLLKEEVRDNQQAHELAIGNDYVQRHGKGGYVSGCAGMYYELGEIDKAMEAMIKSTQEFIRMFEQNERSDPERIIDMIIRPLLHWKQIEAAQKVYDMLHDLYSNPVRYKEKGVWGSRFQSRLEQTLEEAENLIGRSKK